MVASSQHRSTVELLRRAFPAGIADDEYLAVLAVLYPHLADENLAEAVAELTGRQAGTVLNDVYAAGAGGASNAAVVRVREALLSAGLSSWLQEEE